MLSKLFVPIICSWRNICTQLFAGKLTNQNWVNNELNNNVVYDVGGYKHGCYAIMFLFWVCTNMAFVTQIFF
jgi:hypothetical protein